MNAVAGGALRLRSAEPVDAELLVAMFDELNADQGEPTGKATAEAVRRDGFGRDPAFHAVIAMLGEEPIGYILYHGTWSTEEGGPGIYIYDLYVREAARGRGAGRALIAEVVRRAKAEGRVFVWWCAKEWNSGAQKLYAALGAVEEPIRSYAVTGEAFDRLAATAEKLHRSG
ncbi:MAG: GNAT family N-acetyltransferase [Geminicoccaceae bacterium]